VPFIVQKIAGKQSLIEVVSGKALRIGRGTNSDLRFDDVAVGLEHAVIERADRGYRLLDRGSVTGTYVNGKPVHEARLAHNDLINIGGYQIRVQITDPEDPLYLSVRASGRMAAPPPPTTMVAPPSVIAAAVRAAAAQEAAALEAAALEAAAQAASQTAAAPEPTAAATAPTGPTAWEVASGDAAPAADDKTVRMSPEALAAALRAATAMAAAARAAAAPAAGAAPAAAPAPPAGAAGASAEGRAALALGPSTAAVGPPSPPPPALPAAPSPPSPASPSPAAPPPAPASAPPPPPSRRQPPAAPPPVRAQRVDYLQAYGLRRPLFNKALLALVLTVAAAAALLFLVRTGRATAFEPGRVHAWHAETACASCHRPWRGPDPALCSDCHANQREKGEIHQARQTFTPPCTGCHPEHRGGDRVAAVDDTQCASCHGDLRVNPPGEEPRFARRVRGFAGDHPEFSITLPGGARLPLAEAVARRVDPTPLKFNHLKHLRPGLPTPSGRVQLTCQSCHHLPAGAPAGSQPAPGGGPTETPTGQSAADAGATGMVPVTYETSCTTSGCHRLTFDNRRPSQVAPHASTQRVREFLVSVYSDRRGAGESVGDQYRRLIRGAGAQPRGIDYGGQAQGAVVLAERYLYGTACKECHFVDLKTSPPKVTWAPIPARWLPNGRFQHLDHPTDCQLCHGTAAASTVAADVLLPSIAVCRTCHGGSSGLAQVKAGTAPAAPTNCLSCHQYHPDSSNQAAAAGTDS
jgi:hypothetical protein